VELSQKALSNILVNTSQIAKLQDKYKQMGMGESFYLNQVVYY